MYLLARFQRQCRRKQYSRMVDKPWPSCLRRASSLRYEFPLGNLSKTRDKPMKNLFITNLDTLRRLNLTFPKTIRSIKTAGLNEIAPKEWKTRIVSDMYIRLYISKPKHKRDGRKCGSSLSPRKATSELPRYLLLLQLLMPCFLVVWFALFLWHINHRWLFNAKS